MLKSNTIIFVCIFVVVASQKSPSKDVIGFPEIEENPNAKNKENRQPVFLPAMCPVNELYYPGDQKDDWICDCRPAHLYHPKTDKCWPAYRKGPCEEGQYLVLPSTTVIPVCEKNPCVVDGYVNWGGKCQSLGSVAPCAHLYPISAALSVNATSLLIACERLNLESRFGEEKPLANSIVACPPGMRKSYFGKCVTSGA